MDFKSSRRTGVADREIVTGLVNKLGGKKGCCLNKQDSRRCADGQAARLALKTWNHL